MISMAFDPDEKSRTVRGHPIQPEQVILNLGTHAADAMPSGRGITIETANVRINAEKLFLPAQPPGKIRLVRSAS